MRYALIAIACVFLSGCAMMPYDNEFSCPQAEKGVCDSVENAYKGSLKDSAQNSFNMNLEGQGSQKAPMNDAKLSELLAKMEDCSEEGDKGCIKQVRRKIEERFGQAASLGEQKATLDRVGTEEEFRLKEMHKVKGSSPIRINPVVMAITFAPYKSQNGLMIDQHKVFNVVSYGDWVMPELDAEKENGQDIGMVW